MRKPFIPNLAQNLVTINSSWRPCGLHCPIWRTIHPVRDYRPIHFLVNWISGIQSFPHGIRYQDIRSKKSESVYNVKRVYIKKKDHNLIIADAITVVNKCSHFKPRLTPIFFIWRCFVNWWRESAFKSTKLVNRLKLIQCFEMINILNSVLQKEPTRIHNC